jgi:predicted DNA-binding ribbon-helix-helix protein
LQVHKDRGEVWRVLEYIARREGAALSLFLATLHEEAEAIHSEVSNFASPLRCTCAVYLSEKYEHPLNKVTQGVSVN